MEIVKRLKKTQTEEHPDLREQRERRDAQEKAKQEKLYKEKKEREKVEEKRRKEEAELRYVELFLYIISRLRG